MKVKEKLDEEVKAMQDETKRMLRIKQELEEEKART